MTFLQDAWHFSYMYLCTFQLMGNVSNISKHELIQHTDTKAKCCHLKKFNCKGPLRQVFIQVYRLEIQSVMLVFATQLCELLPL